MDLEPSTSGTRALFDAMNKILASSSDDENDEQTVPSAVEEINKYHEIAGMDLELIDL